MTNDPKNWYVVDLFCGIGGLSHGFVQEGFNLVAGYDSDGSCKFAYEANNGATFINRKIEETTGAEIADRLAGAGATILVGCAPCQPFSLYTVKQPKDGKWKLLQQFHRLIASVLPDVVSMENVPDLEEHPVFTEFVAGLKRLGYQVSHTAVFCPDYGVPQRRRRLVLLASKLGDIQLIRKTHPKGRWRTVKHAIGRLEPIKAGERSRRDRIHQARSLNETNLKRLKNSTPGGSWKNWPDELKLACHRKSTGQTYPSIYGRMKWDELAPTLTTHCTGIGNGRFGHPIQDRAISLREAALLQTFPRWYKFVAPREKVLNKMLSRHIGNAVPVRLGRVIARSIKRHLEKVAILGRNGSPDASATQLRDVSRGHEGYSAGTPR